MKKKKGKGTHDFRGEREGRGVRGRGDKEEEESKVTKHFADVKVNGKRRSQESRNALPCRRREETDDVDEDDEGRLATERSTRERERRRRRRRRRNIDDRDRRERETTKTKTTKEDRQQRSMKERSDYPDCFVFVCVFVTIDLRQMFSPLRPTGQRGFQTNPMDVTFSDLIELKQIFISIHICAIGA